VISDPVAVAMRARERSPVIGHHQHCGVSRIEKACVLHHDCRPDLVGLWGLGILGGIPWILAPVDSDNLTGLEVHAGVQRLMGSGLVQASMKGWASGSAAM